jgi:CheY-like chemotaxis protein
MSIDPSDSGRTILLVEDSSRIRRLVRDILIGLGWEILEASTAEEAVTIAAASLAPIDLLLTDLEMPGMSGLELAGELRGRFPAMKVLCMSGHVLPAVPLDDVHFIEKPFLPHALLAKVRQLV